MTWYALLVGTVALSRLVELSVARRHEAAARAAGAVESGRGHYPVMVALHTALLVGCLVEAPFRAWQPALGVPMLVLLAAAHALRWWCIRSLGVAWNTKVLVVPGARLVARGPYRWGSADARGPARLLRHPNYAAVVLEGIALPLVHGAWITAATFTVADLLLLRVRVRVEEEALAAMTTPETRTTSDGERTASAGSVGGRAR